MRTEVWVLGLWKCLSAWTPGTEVRASQAEERDGNVQRDGERSQ